MTHDYYITLLPNLQGIFENRLYAQTWGGAQNAPRPTDTWFRRGAKRAPPEKLSTVLRGKVREGKRSLRAARQKRRSHPLSARPALTPPFFTGGMASPR